MNELELIVYMLPKLFIATVCGLIIGWEREMKNKVAGIRTHVLVCVGACMFTSIAFVIVGNTIDPTRIIGQIITGIGFLGGGVIFKHDDRVVGVTSAAFIWFISSIGVFIGIGYLFSSLIFTIGLVLLLLALQKLENKLKKNENN